MKNHDKASLPKIQIKQVQVLNRVLTNNAAKSGAQGGVNGMMGWNPTEVPPTNTVSGIY
ncbi:hypothetical protein AAFN85_28155 [Mucilaginibacter sp. CAU 1740]|uniref:hypothetical protein n=1 Tax=Mucilaginibacter sp. CAU 1740 TaxID=3140365 RepID=UPI00325BDA6D